MKNGGTMPSMPAFSPQNMQNQPNLYQNQYQQQASGFPSVPSMPFYNPFGMGGLGTNPFNPQIQLSLDEQTYKSQLR